MPARKIASRDGTSIAYETRGEGPALILVDGATASREASVPLAELLSKDFRVYCYDRRGRGDSSDTLPYAVEKEVEDIAALIAAAGGCASLFGMSSGGRVGARSGHPPGPGPTGTPGRLRGSLDSSDGGGRAWHEFRPRLAKLLAAGDHEGALTFFMQFVGAPPPAIEALRKSPQWKSMVATAPTLAYDVEVVGPDRVVPTGRVARIAVPTLIMDGGASRETMPFMRATAEELTRAIPGARHETLPGQAHDVDQGVLAAALAEFLGATSDAA